MSSLNYVLRRFIVGPPVRALFPAHVVGLEHLPEQGPFILAAGPHRTELESVLLACNLPQLELRFFAKAEYWRGSKFWRWFMDGTGMIPIDREDSRAAIAQIDKGAEVLRGGGIVAVYPEGTRGGDEFVHRGHTGAARTALKASKLVDGNVPIVPVGMIGMRKLNPPGKKFRLRPGRCTIVIGEPIYPFSHPSGVLMTRRMGSAVSAVENDSLLAKPATAAHARILTDRLMKRIARLGAVRYLDEYLAIGAAGSKE